VNLVHDYLWGRFLIGRGKIGGSCVSVQSLCAHLVNMYTGAIKRCFFDDTNLWPDWFPVHSWRWEGSTTVVYTVVWRKSRGLMRGRKYGALIGQKTRFFVSAQYATSGYGFLYSQSQRCIYPFSSNHGISPNDSVNYSGWPPQWRVQDSGWEWPGCSVWEHALGLRVWGSGFRLWGWGFRLWYWRFWLRGRGFRLWGLGYRLWDLGFRLWGLGFGLWGLGYRLWSLGFRLWGLGFRLWGLGYRLWG